MIITINRLLEGAKTAKGITVVIDVFRASNTIMACLASGANSIIPVGEIDDARKLKKENSTHLLLGERGGIMIEGFDYGNSPVEVSKMNLKTKTVILTTSAGSQGIVYSDKADEIIIGSFANSQAIVDYIKNKNPKIVTLLAIGDSATEPAVEDEECAKYIKAKLLGDKVDFRQMKKNIFASKGADRLRSLNQEDDLEFCTRLDIYNIVAKYTKDENIKAVL